MDKFRPAAIDALRGVAALAVLVSHLPFSTATRPTVVDAGLVALAERALEGKRYRWWAVLAPHILNSDPASALRSAVARAGRAARRQFSSGG